MVSACVWQVLAEMCQSGYKDAFRFLQENSECFLSSVSLYLKCSFRRYAKCDMRCGLEDNL